MLNTISSDSLLSAAWPELHGRPGFAYRTGASGRLTLFSLCSQCPFTWIQPSSSFRSFPPKGRIQSDKERLPPRQPWTFIVTPSPPFIALLTSTLSIFFTSFTPLPSFPPVLTSILNSYTYNSPDDEDWRHVAEQCSRRYRTSPKFQ